MAPGIETLKLGAYPLEECHRKVHVAPHHLQHLSHRRCPYTASGLTRRRGGGSLTVFSSSAFRAALCAWPTTTVTIGAAFAAGAALAAAADIGTPDDAAGGLVGPAERKLRLGLLPAALSSGAAAVG
jgi:hypothetical protein